MPVKKSAIGYLSNLDVLRFFLALFVVVFHVPEISKNSGLPHYDGLPLLRRGNEAVYWFFVLSGFLLSLLATREQSNGQFNIRRFFMRRVLRIWPVYFLVSFFGLLFYYVVLPLLHIPFENKAGFETALLLQSFFLSNILHAFYDPGGILTITWSVSVEEQFYLFFPFLVFFVYRWFFLKRVVVVLLLLLVCGLYLFLPSAGSILQQLGLYLELFLIGIIAAELFQLTKSFHDKVKDILAAFSLVLFAVLFFTDWLMIPDNPFLWRLANGGAAAIVVLSLSVWHRKISLNLLILGGKISYGIYMYHMIVVTGLVFVFQKLALQVHLVIWFMNLLSIAMTYLFAIVSFRFFEGRFLQMKKY